MVRISTNQYHQTALNALLDQQNTLSKVQEQIASGKRILSPSDDPSGAARVLELAQSIESTERYNRNIDAAESRMGLEESTLNEVSSTLQRVRELAVQAKNDSNTAEDRKKIAAEVREQWKHLVQLGNTTDGNGEYLFAGAQSGTRPFQTQADDTVQYAGDQTARRLQVGAGRSMETTHTGYETFMDMPASYEVTATTGSTGTATAAVAVNTSVTQREDVSGYEVRFTETADGGFDYAVVDDSGNAVTDSDGNAITGRYEAGRSIQLPEQGVELTLHGQPADGDALTIQADSDRSMFDAVERFASALENASDTEQGRSAFQAAGDRALAEVDAGLENVERIRAEVGGRLNGLDSERNANEAAALELKSARSTIQDLDYASAISEFSRRLTGMQAAQQSYSKIQGMSLFNYL
ncbi:flagellar hook-associated protein FlgL [Arhodomonas aquaeolei]|uniref:flagellar hook-associated protein FlgL n=1 Tax=Arhodomonas TaxID=2368 RepID=UPI0021680D90|nr:flagellar hook-associated protein FlgL [Arhodomonas aquaeolei]MCS4502807.1 flagellar hook-associated protein FlgL [Arhodomonas aquaeolei]